MTLKQLTTFYWVYRLGNFAMAAEYLHSTQSAVSMRIQELETSLGVELFDRSLRSARLTSKGRELIKYVERLIATTNEIQHVVGSPGAVTGTLRLGSTELVAISWLPRLVNAIHERCPGVVLQLDVDSATNQTRKLQRGNIDLAILPGPIEDTRYTQLPVGSVEFVWVASENHEIPSSHLSPQDLQKYPVLTLSPESLSYRSVDRWFEQNGASIERLDICNSLGVLAALASAGTGVAYLPERSVAPGLFGPGLRVLNLSPKLPKLDYYLVYESGLAQAAVHIVCELARAISTFSNNASIPLVPDAD